MANNVTIVPGLSLTVTNNSVSSGATPTNIILPGNVVYTAQTSAYFEFFPINNTVSQGPGFTTFPVITNLPVLYVRNLDTAAIATITVSKIGGATNITIPIGPLGFLLLFNASNVPGVGVASGGITAISSVANSLIEIFYAA